MPSAVANASPLRVLLVNAPPFEVVEPWYDRPSFGRHGLACLAGHLRDHADVELCVIDGKLERLSFEQVVERARDFGPDLIALTAFTNEINAVAHVTALLKQALPNARTLLGGVHVTSLPERTLQEFPVFDAGCIGEGETTFVEFVKALQAGSSLADVAGLVIREAQDGGPDTVRRTAPRPKVMDLDTLSPPAWDLFPRAEEYWVMTQRGCPFSCRFCFNPNGRIPRQLSVSRVLDEIEMILDGYAPRKLWFADEIFTVDMERSHRLLDAMTARSIGSRVEWWAETHVQFVDDALFAAMRRAGCTECGLGIESGDERTLRALGKGTNIKSIVEAFASAKKAGIKSIGFFVFGHPNETRESLRATIDLAVKVNPTIPIFGVMVPYPGTEVARLAARGEAGYRLKTDDWSAYNKQIGAALEFAGLSRRQIEALQLWAYVKVFLMNGRFRELGALAWERRTTGLRLLKKVLSPGTREQKESIIDPSSANELATAAERWQAGQVANVHSLRSRIAEAPKEVAARTGTRRLKVLSGPTDDS